MLPNDEFTLKFKNANTKKIRIFMFILFFQFHNNHSRQCATLMSQGDYI